MLVHNFNSGRTTLCTATNSKERAVNGGDWSRIQRLYNASLVEYYKYYQFARNGIKFSKMLDKGLAKEITKEHGLFQPFWVYLTVYYQKLPNETARRESWSRPGSKLRFQVHPEDPHFYSRLVHALCKHYRMPGEIVDDIATLDVEFTDTKTNQKIALNGSSRLQLVLGQFMTADHYQIVALVKKLAPGERRWDEHFKTFETPFEKISASLGGSRASSSPSLPTTIQDKKNELKKKKKAGYSYNKAHSSSNIASSINSLSPNRSLEERKLHPIAEKISELISCEMCKEHDRMMEEATLGKQGKKSKKRQRKMTSRMISDQMVVGRSVHSAVLNDELYKVHGASGAEDYWRKKNVNIGQLINNITTAVTKETSRIDVSYVLKKQEKSIGAELGSSSSRTYNLDQDAAKKVFHTAMIESCLWEKFKEWTGYYGVNDDGGADLGPTASVALARGYRNGSYVCQEDPPVYPPVHSRAYYPLDTLDYPATPSSTTTVLPPIMDESGPTTIHQSVIVRRSDDHHDHHHHCSSVKAHHHKKRCHIKDGDNSESSDEDDHLLDRALRKKRGLSSRHSDSSSSDSDSSSGSDTGSGVMVEKKKVVTTTTAASSEVMFKKEDHSHFLEILQRAYPDASKLKSEYIIMVPSNKVFDEKNMGAVVTAVEVKKTRTYKQFVRNYLVPMTSFASLENPTKTLELVSESGVIYRITHPARRLCVADSVSSHFRIDDPRLLVNPCNPCALLCHGYPRNIRFMTIHVIHSNLPKRG